MKAFETISKHYSLVITPKYFRKTKRIFLSIVCLILLCLIFVPWQQTSKGTGKVIAFSPDDRQQKIEAPIYGRIGKWYVNEGSVVQKGQPIVEVLDNDPQILDRIRTERNAVLKRLDALKQGAETSKINVDRQNDLYKKGLSSKRDYELSLLEYSKYLAEEAKASAELTKIDIKLARQSNQVITSPVNGIILNRMQGLNSQFVKDGDTLATIVPKTSSRAVEIWIDGNDMPLIHAKDKVRLQFEGWPALQFSGWPNLSFGTFGGIVSFVDPTDDGSGRFRIVIIPDVNDTAWPDSNYLRQGVRTVGWVLLNQVSLGYELWRQFNGFPPGSQDKWKKTFSK